MKFLAFFVLCVYLAHASPIIQAENEGVIEAAETVDPYRLPETVKPMHYDLKLSIPEDFKVSKKFEGSLIITFILNGIANADLKTISLHRAEEMEINDSDILVDGKAIKASTYDNETEIMVLEINTIDLQAPTLHIEFKKFTAVLYEDMYGLYLSTYKEGGNEEALLTTQFQATYARRAFPCFDEPLFKATFQLAITHPSGYNALFNQPSNTKITENTPKAGYTTTSFETTVKMSPYLVAFIVSKFKSQTIDKYNLWARPEAVDTLSFAASVTPGIVNSMNKFTEVDYWGMGMNQLDQVAIPDFSAGAMENWGLMTFRETALLWDKDHSTIRNQQRVASVVAHELAHMWFGDYVTCKWWSDTWLNEGFARYFEYFATHDVKPEWNLHRQFVVEQIHAVFPLDSVVHSLPLSNPKTSTADDVKAMFGSISYNKGGTIVRMMSHIFGHEAFRKSLVQYLSENKFKNTEPYQLFEKLPKINGENAKTALETWTTQSGFPVVTVTLNGNEAVLSQKRFLYTPNKDDKTIWHIPINWATDAEPDFQDTAPKLWLVQAEGTQKINMTDRNWIVLNKQQTGYYRVNYSGDLWTRLVTALKKWDHDGIDVINRAQIVDDAMNLARAGEISYSVAMDVSDYLHSETAYYPWYSAFNAFSYLRKRLSGTTKNTITNYMSELSNNLYNSVTFDETGDEGHVEMLKKVLALKWACELNREECYTRANAMFDDYKEGKAVPNNLRSIVYCAALRHTDTEDNWNYLWEQFKKVTVAHESTTMITALGCTKKPEQLQKYLSYSINSTSGIRKQDAYSVFTAVLTGNPEGVDVAFQFLKNNYKDIITSYGSMNALTSVINNVADRLTTKEQLTEFEAFVTEHKTELHEAAVVAEAAIETAKANIEWGDKYKTDLDAWFAKRNSVATLVVSNSLLAVAFLGVIARFF